ncbi:hypothetical protein ABZS66_19230 [Dactylosporangium sp. NPDC005572]|uniref:hypothetical protein n=1 Tax=Dactylosporangium sp. NPDC005572 TaxID=3156889 RepID=UPI0033A59AAD
MSLQLHANAFLGLLRESAGLVVLPVAPGTPGSGRGIVPAGRKPPYVVAYFAAERPSGGRLDGRSTRMVVRGYFHCVGETTTAAQAVADQVAAAVLDVKPVIAGRACWPIRHEASQPPPEPNESTGGLVVDLVDVYRLESMPG